MHVHTHKFLLQNTCCQIFEEIDWEEARLKGKKYALSLLVVDIILSLYSFLTFLLHIVSVTQDALGGGSHRLVVEHILPMHVVICLIPGTPAKKI